MAKVGLFYGTDTGNTERVAKSTDVQSPTLVKKGKNSFVLVK